MAAGIAYKDNRMPLSHTNILLYLPAHARSPPGYTVVFKDDVSEETVIKYMSDIVDAGGRLTQAYDPFLNVRADVSDCQSFPLSVLISTNVIAGLLRCYP